MDVCLLIRRRLAELGLDQKDLAAAAKVTESYVSQLLTRKKMPPAPERTDIYDRMSRALKLPIWLCTRPRRAGGWANCAVVMKDGN